MISVYNVRYLFGSIVLVSHFLALAVYAIVGSMEYPANGDFLEVILPGMLALMPVTGTYAIAFWKFVIRDGAVTEIDSRPMKRRPFLVQLMMLLFFSVVLIVGIWWTLHGELNEVSLFVGGMETIFGVFIGSIFNSLFPIRGTMAES